MTRAPLEEARHLMIALDRYVDAGRLRDVDLETLETEFNELYRILSYVLEWAESMQDAAIHVVFTPDLDS